MNRSGIHLLDVGRNVNAIEICGYVNGKHYYGGRGYMEEMVKQKYLDWLVNFRLIVKDDFSRDEMDAMGQVLFFAWQAGWSAALESQSVGTSTNKQMVEICPRCGGSGNIPGLVGPTGAPEQVCCEDCFGTGKHHH